MDYDCNWNQNAYYVEAKKVSEEKRISQVKQKAFHIMKELEGWCSEQKAGILIDLIFQTKPNVIVEIGVFGGKSLVPMSCALKEIGKGTIYGIDPWSASESVEGMDGVNKDYWGKVDHDAILKGLVSKIEFYHLTDHIQLVRSTSEQAKIIPNIDILHVDGNHSEKASYLDVTKWVPYVKRGGLIIFDDIGWETTGLAVQWLNQRATKIAEYQGDNIWGVWVKK